MKKITDLKIAAGLNEKVLIDEFGSPTKEGLLAAGLGILSAIGGLVILKDILVLLVSRQIRKGKKKVRKARKAKAKLKNKAMKQQAKLDHSDLKQQLKEQTRVNKDLLKQQEKLLAGRPLEQESWKLKLVKKFI